MKKLALLLKTASVLAAAAAGLCLGVPLFLRMALHLTIHSTNQAGASVGVIGGADGPTAIFIAGGPDLAVLPWLGCLLAAGATGLWFSARYLGKKQG